MFEMGTLEHWEFICYLTFWILKVRLTNIAIWCWIASVNHKQQQIDESEIA